MNRARTAQVDSARCWSLVTFGVTATLLIGVVAFLAAPINAFRFAQAFCVAVVPIVVVELALVGLFLAIARNLRGSRLFNSALATALGAFLLAVVLPAPEETLARRAADLIDVVVYRGDLDQQLREARLKGGSPELAAVEIGGGFGGGYGIAYDASGELAFPLDKRSKSWEDAASNTLLGIDNLEVRHVFGNYYAFGY